MDENTVRVIVVVALLIAVVLIVIVLSIKEVMLGCKKEPHCERGRGSCIPQHKICLNLSDNEDHVIIPKLTATSSIGSNNKISQQDLSNLVHQRFRVRIEPDLLHLVDWDDSVMEGMICNARQYNPEREHVWDFRTDMGIPALIIASNKDYSHLLPPSSEAMDNLHFLMDKELIDKAAVLINDLYGDRMEIISKTIIPTDQRRSGYAGGYWWIKDSSNIIFKSTKYPGGVVGHRTAEGVHRLNLLCTSEDFERLMDRYIEHCNEKHGKGKK